MYKFVLILSQINQKGNLKMLNKLKKLISKHGIVTVTFKLGYRSPNTVLHWVNNGAIPEIAKEKVGKLIKDLK